LRAASGFCWAVRAAFRRRGQPRRQLSDNPAASLGSDSLKLLTLLLYLIKTVFTTARCRDLRRFPPTNFGVWSCTGALVRLVALAARDGAGDARAGGPVACPRVPRGAACPLLAGPRMVRAEPRPQRPQDGRTRGRRTGAHARRAAARVRHGTRRRAPLLRPAARLTVCVYARARGPTPRLLRADHQCRGGLPARPRHVCARRRPPRLRGRRRAGWAARRCGDAVRALAWPLLRLHVLTRYRPRCHAPRSARACVRACACACACASSASTSSFQ